MGELIVLIMYFVVAIIVAKALHFYEKWDRKREGIYNWDDVDPTADIIIGFIWPLSLPVIVVLVIFASFINLLRVLFFR